MHILPNEIKVVKDSCDIIENSMDITVFRNGMDRKLFVCDYK